MPNRESPLTIIMGQSLVKGNKMDSIIQKATELGVSEVFPFLSSRSIPYLDKGRIEHRVNRWRRIAVESSKQCGRLIPLRIETVAKFDDVLERASLATKRIILWEKGTRSLASLFRERNATACPSPKVYFLVGPEGGFSEEEIKRAERAHFVPVGLGSRILRVETAGLSFVSILQYEWGDLR
jgi:16S rRNA (uracil1498-N3)-methyltransferase